MSYRDLPRGQVWYLFIVEYGATSWFMPEAEAGHTRAWAANQITEHDGKVAEVWEFVRGVAGDGSK